MGDNWEELKSFTNDVSCCPINDSKISVNTLEGSIFASIGDYIVRGINGEVYPVKPDIFAKTYEDIQNVN